MRCITMSEFKAELKAQGVAREHFAVKCVSCGAVQSRQDFVDEGVTSTIEEAQRFWGTSCVGRWSGDIGCDWTLGGLFQIHELEIDFEDGEECMPMFELASPKEAQWHAKIKSNKI